MKTYNVKATIERIVNFVIDAESEEEAKKKALNWECKEELTDSEEVKSIDSVEVQE